MTNKKIIKFYNNSLEYFKKDRLQPNPRHIFIKQQISKFINSKTKALDLGCGIGITTQYLKEMGAEVIGIDISPELIKYAKKTVGGNFICADITQIKLKKKYDFILLADVVYHIPNKKYKKLFEIINEHSHDGTIVAIFMPNPYYTEYIKRNNPSLLQIVDEIASIERIIKFAYYYNFELKFFTNYGINAPEQYIYLLFRKRDINLETQMWGNIYKITDEETKKENRIINRSVQYSNKKKIAFFASANNFHFLDEIIDTLFQEQEYEIKKFNGKTINELYELMKWSDISWFEWCDEPLILATKLPKVCKIICRLHTYESYTKTPSMVRWGKVDRLIFTIEHIKDRVKSFVPFLEERVKTNIVHYGINLNKFTFRKKEKGNNIAFVVYRFRHLKNIPFLLQCFKALIKERDTFHLHIAGDYNIDNMEVIEIREYVNHIIKLWNLEKNIHFYGFVKDINSWLEDKHFIISTSVREGNPWNIMEAMAKGIKPIIHNFPGAEKIYPHKYLFTTPEECVKLILSNEYNPLEYRKFIEENYSFEKQMSEIKKIFSEVLKNE